MNDTNKQIERLEKDYATATAKLKKLYEAYTTANRQRESVKMKLRDAIHRAKLIPLIGKPVRNLRPARVELKEGTLMKVRRTRALVEFEGLQCWLIPIEDLESVDAPVKSERVVLDNIGQALTKTTVKLNLA